MNRKQPKNAYGIQIVDITAVYKGAGAADPTIPTTAEANVGWNAAEVAAGARTGVGVYNLKLKADAAVPRACQIIPHVEGAALQAFVTTQYNATTRQFTVSVFTAAGVAAELTSGTAFLKCLVVGQDSTS